MRNDHLDPAAPLLYWSPGRSHFFYSGLRRKVAFELWIDLFSSAASIQSRGARGPWGAGVPLSHHIHLPWMGPKLTTCHHGAGRGDPIPTRNRRSNRSERRSRSRSSTPFGGDPWRIRCPQAAFGSKVQDSPLELVILVRTSQLL